MTCLIVALDIILGLLAALLILAMLRLAVVANKGKLL